MRNNLRIKKEGFKEDLIKALCSLEYKILLQGEVGRRALTLNAVAMQMTNVPKAMKGMKYQG